MVRRLGLGKNNHLTYASLALNPRYVSPTEGKSIELASIICLAILMSICSCLAMSLNQISFLTKSRWNTEGRGEIMHTISFHRSGQKLSIFSILTFTPLRANSADDSFVIFPRKEASIFHSNCLHFSFRVNLHEISKHIFWETVP